MSIVRKIRRLGQMSAAEIKSRAAHFFRIRQERMTLSRNGRAQAWQQIWSGASGTFPPPDFAEQFARRASPRFFFLPGERDVIASALRSRAPEYVAAVLAAADDACRHRFQLFAYPCVQAGSEIPWRRDLVHGTESGLEHWSRFVVPDFSRTGDPKIVWEPNRHQHFLLLGQAFAFTGEERYAEECLAQLEHWRRENPWRHGINWSSSLELAFRTWSWLWALHLLGASRALAGGRLAAWMQAFAEHARSIEQNLSTYSSPNTHLLGEGFALFVIGLMLPELRGAGAWRSAGRRILEEEMENQVRPDGSHAEQSTFYHRYATDFFLCAAILAARNNCPFSPKYRSRLEGMCEFLLHLQLPSGLHPMIGDADGGRLLALRPNASPVLANDQRATLSTAALYFLRGDFRAAAGRLHEESIWLLGPGAMETFASLAPESRGGSRVFRNAGVAVQRAGQGARERMLLFDAGPQGMANCGHGHADSLQVLLHADGVEWLTDPGTYAYSSSPEWRDAFRGTRFHNTLAVDGADQAVPLDIFQWAQVPSPRLELAASTPLLDVAAGSHDGYRRLPGDVVHRRTVIFVKPDYWILSDEISGAGRHALDFCFHFPPEAGVHATSSGWIAECAGKRLVLGCSPNIEGRTSRAEAAPRQGWHSRDYGEKEPATALVCTWAGELPVRVHWLLAPAPDDPPYLAVLPGGSLRVEFGVNGHRDLVAFRQEPAMPQQELQTDASVAFVRRSSGGEIERFALIEGCCASLDGQPLLRVDSMLDTLNVERLGSLLKIQACPARAVALFAPGITRIEFNGDSRPVTEVNGWLELE